MSKAKKISFFSFAVLLFIINLIYSPSASNSSSQEFSADERQKIAEKFKALQKDIHSMTASVSQEKHLSALKKKVHIEGIVILAKPNMLRWDIVKPDRSITVIDGETMTAYHPDIKEAQVYTLSENFIARNTMSFFATAMGGDLSEMEKKFSVTIYKDNKGVVFRLTPLSKMVLKYLSHIIIRYDEYTGLPAEFEVNTPKGDRTITKLYNIKTNPELSPEIFKLKLSSDTWITNSFEQNNN